MSPTAIRSLIDGDPTGDCAAGTVAGAPTAGAPGSDARAVAGAAGAAGAVFAPAAGAAVPVAAPGQPPGSACGDNKCHAATQNSGPTPEIDGKRQPFRSFPATRGAK